MRTLRCSQAGHSFFSASSVRWGTFMFAFEDCNSCAAYERVQMATRTKQTCSTASFAVMILLALGAGSNPQVARAQTPDPASGRDSPAHAIAQQFAEPAAAAPSQPDVPSGNVPVVRYQSNGAGESPTEVETQARLSFVPREDFLRATAASPPATTAASPPAVEMPVAVATPVAVETAPPPQAAKPEQVEPEHVAAVEREPTLAEPSADARPAEAEGAAPVVKRKVKPASASTADEAEPEPAKPKRVRVHKRKVVKAPAIEEKVVVRPRQPQLQNQQPPQRKAVQPPDDDEQQQAEAKNRAPVRRQVQTLAPASNADQPSALSNLGTKILSTLGLIQSEPGVPAQLDWDKRQQ